MSCAETELITYLEVIWHLKVIYHSEFGSVLFTRYPKSAHSITEIELHIKTGKLKKKFCAVIPR